MPQKAHSRRCAVGHTSVLSGGLWRHLLKGSGQRRRTRPRRSLADAAREPIVAALMENGLFTGAVGTTDTRKALRPPLVECDWSKVYPCIRKRARDLRDWRADCLATERCFTRRWTRIAERHRCPPPQWGGHRNGILQILRQGQDRDNSVIPSTASRPGDEWEIACCGQTPPEKPPRALIAKSPAMNQAT